MCLPLGKALLLSYDNKHLIFLYLKLSLTVGSGLRMDSVRCQMGAGRPCRPGRQDLALTGPRGSEVSESQNRTEGVEALESPGEKRRSSKLCVWVAGSHQGRQE